MKNRAVTFFGAAALVAQCVVVFGCSSGSGGAATGGSTGTPAGTGGAGGSSTGAGGTGSGMCTAANTAAPIGDPCVNVKNKDACDMDGIAGTVDDKNCWNTCGPNKSGTKNCNCVAKAWNCPTCDYDLSNPKAFDCYKTDTATACPPDATDTSGAMLPASGGACTQAPCKPCGSATANSYRDGSGTPKMGWCICVPKTDGTGSVYSCASVKEWAPQCN